MILGIRLLVMPAHNGEFEQQVLRTSELSEFDTFDKMVDDCWSRGDAAISHLAPSTLEGCVARLSDMIAYVGKDRQDAIRAGLCEESSFDDGMGGAYNAWALRCFTADVVEHSVGRPYIAMSKEGFEELRRAKRENYRKIYGAPEVGAAFDAGMSELFHRLYERVYDDLASHRTETPVFRHHVRYVEQWLTHYGRSYAWEDDLDLTTVDYISSMTDDYCMAIMLHLFPEAKQQFPRCVRFGASGAS